MIELERLADYLRWVAPSLVVLIGYPIALVLACWITAGITRRFLTKRYEIQDRAELKAVIRDLEGQMVEGRRAADLQSSEIGRLKARIRENLHLAAQLASNYGVVSTEGRET